MNPSYFMPLPRRVLVFGAMGRMGPGLVSHIQRAQPDVRVRLVTSKDDRHERLVSLYPQAEVTIASYFDQASLERALDDVQAVFLITPTFLDEQSAMSNFIAAAKKARNLQHIVRIVGDPPGMRLERVPQVLKDFGGGTAIQHLIARDMLERSELPVTYLNITNSYADNFLRAAPMLKRGYWVVPHDRLIGYVDPAEVGEAAARILLSNDSRHILQHYNLDNGESPRRNHEVVALMSEIFGYPIELIVSPELYAEEVGPVLNQRYGHDRGAEFMLAYMQFEEANELAFRASDFLETTLGRSPRTLREWLIANASHFERN